MQNDRNIHPDVNTFHNQITHKNVSPVNDHVLTHASVSNNYADISLISDRATRNSR